MSNAFVVPSARDESEAAKLLEIVMTGAHCTWPERPSRMFVDYVLVEAIHRGIVAFDDAPEVAA